MAITPTVPDQLEQAKIDLAKGIISDVEFAQVFVATQMAREKREATRIRLRRHVSFNMKAIQVYETYSHDEYDRAMHLPSRQFGCIEDEDEDEEGGAASVGEAASKLLSSIKDIF